MPYRLLFYTVGFNPQEKEIADRVYREVLKDPEYTYPRWWVEGDTMRFVHEFQFNEYEIVKVKTM